MAISQDLLDFLNYFICPIPSHWEEHEFKIVMLLSDLGMAADGNPSPLIYDDAQVIKELPEFAAFAASFEGLRQQAKRSRELRDELLQAILRQSKATHELMRTDHTSGVNHHTTSDALESSWYHFTRFDGYYDALHSKLNIELTVNKSHGDFEREWADPSKSKPFYQIGREIRDENNDIFQALRTIVRIRDAAFQRRNARFIAADRLGLRSTSGVKPAREDWEVVRREVVESLNSVLPVVNQFLGDENADFRLHIGYIHIGFDDESTWRRAQRVRPFEFQSLAWETPSPGQSLSGFAEKVVLPILEYLIDPKPVVRLGQCENTQCGCIFLRPSNATTKRFCCDACRRAAE